MTGLPHYYRANVTWVDTLDLRLSTIADLVCAERPGRVLDLGCGQGVLLDALAHRLPDAQLVGIDANDPPRDAPWHAIIGDIAEHLPFSDASFEVVIAGEVIEHVPNPDLMLTEIRRILTPQGRLVLSTPNIVSWANRVLVPFGIQPLFTETSSEIHLGRRWRVLGQGNQVQGHLKVFSYRALTELLHRSGYTRIRTLGMPAEFPSPIDRLDRLFARFPSISSDIVVVATRTDRIPSRLSPRRKDGRDALSTDPHTPEGRP